MYCLFYFQHSYSSHCKTHFRCETFHITQRAYMRY